MSHDHKGNAKTQAPPVAAANATREPRHFGTVPETLRKPPVQCCRSVIPQLPDLSSDEFGVHPPRFVIELDPGSPSSSVLLSAAILATPVTHELGIVIRGLDRPTEREADAVAQWCGALAAGRALPSTQLLGIAEATDQASVLTVQSSDSPMQLAEAITRLCHASLHPDHDPRGQSDGMSSLLDARDKAIRRREASRHPDVTPIIAVVAQVQSTWPAVSDVVRMIARTKDLRVEVIAVPSEHEVRTHDMAAFLSREGHNPRDLAWLSQQLKDPSGGLALAIFYDPWDGLRPQATQALTMAQHGIRIAYIPYGTNVGAGKDTESYAYDLPMHRLAQRVYARSTKQKEMFGQFCRVGNEHVRVLGVPKFDRALRLGDKDPTETSVIMWNPHFSVSHDGWSTFFDYVDHFANYAERHSDVTLLVRPHFRLLRDAPLVGGRLLQAVRKLYQTADRLPNFEIDLDADYIHAFARSDAMISDLSSLIPEYLATGRPLLYLHRRDGPGVNQDAQYFFECPTALNWAAVEAFLDVIRRGKEADGPRRQLTLERHFELLDGHSAERIATDLTSLVLSQGRTNTQLEER